MRKFKVVLLIVLVSTALSLNAQVYCDVAGTEEGKCHIVNEPEYSAAICSSVIAIGTTCRYDIVEPPVLGGN
jgi:hypothetical protein